MDVFNDFLLDSIYQYDGTLGLRQFGNFGVLNSSKLKAKYPKLHALIHGIHEKRYQSDLSHARQKKTGRPTRVIRFRFVRTAKRLIRDAVAEASMIWPG